MLFLLASCQPPVTRAPQVTDAELQQERMTQAELAARAGVDRQEKRLETQVRMQERMVRVFLPVAREGAQVCAQLRGAAEEGAHCVFDIRLADKDDPGSSGGINASADGERIFVTPAMMRFAHEDSELALVLSHELAHNILRHPQAMQTNVAAGSVLGTLVDVFAASQGYSTGGAFSDLGGGVGMLAYLPAYESEADYVGMYIMARAGYDFRNAANFWRRMSERDPDGIYISSTHPSNPERFVSMRKTADEIAVKKSRGLPLLPEARQ